MNANETANLICHFYDNMGPHIVRHYLHAVKKHPYFADKLTTHSADSSDWVLFLKRMILKDAAANHDVVPSLVLACEWEEAVNAIVHGDTAQAIKECFDAIAVLLRTIDVLEGRQPLGDPSAAGTTKGANQ